MTEQERTLTAREHSDHPRRFDDLPFAVRQRVCHLVEVNRDDPDQAPVIFDFQGFGIHDPFRDESLRTEVDPVEHYGEAFLRSAFVDDAA